MHLKLKLFLTKQILDNCDVHQSYLVHSLVPEIEGTPSILSKTYSNTLNSVPNFLESILTIFCGQKRIIAQQAYEFQKLVNNQKEFMNLINEHQNQIGLDDLTINDNKVDAALAILSNIYFESFTRPIQFFLPHSSACSGQWTLWEKNNYFELLNRINDKEFIFFFTKNAMEKKSLTIKFKPEHFPEIVRRRLMKDNSLGKKLDKEAMIKALIIRLGEMAKANNYYEVIDYCIRSFFTYLGVKKYLRVDREMEFLRRFEIKVKEILNE